MTKRIAVLTIAVLLGGSTLLYAQSAPPLRSAWSGVYSAAQADKGKTLFEDNCAKCHGGTLDGNDEIPPLKGSHFMADWESQTVAEHRKQHGGGGLSAAAERHGGRSDAPHRRHRRAEPH